MFNNRVSSVQRSAYSLQVLAFLLGTLLFINSAWAQAQAQARTNKAYERDPMTMRVVAVNPSAEKNQEVPVRIDLPTEIGPKDILDSGELTVEFDTEQNNYYVFKDAVSLTPKQTRVFEVVVNDVWFYPEEELGSLQHHTELVLERIAGTDYFDAASKLGDSIMRRLEKIRVAQSDESISRKRRIGAYRRNSEVLKAIKEDLARMEKLLTFTGGPPVPELLEESPLKSDAPSTTTTWLVIFLIMVFMGLLAGQFYFTWHRRVKASEGGARRAAQQKQAV